MTEKQNIEIKAHYEKHRYARKILEEKDARKEGLDNQKDTYFNVKKGRLKIREGDIENSLIYYQREDKETPKISNVSICKLKNPEKVKKVLKTCLGVKVVVEKEREIYWLENIKVHLDRVKDLGKFIEFELMKDKEGSYDTEEDLKNLMGEFKVEKDDLIDRSYSDMI